jgi:hypothetical protein
MSDIKKVQHILVVDNMLSIGISGEYTTYELTKPQIDYLVLKLSQAKTETY